MSKFLFASTGSSFVARHLPAPDENEIGQMNKNGYEVHKQCAVPDWATSLTNKAVQKNNEF